jgi:hypothetical protein
VGAASVQRLDNLQASHLEPWTFKFAVVRGDTLELDVAVDVDPTFAEIWFYGWKFMVSHVNELPEGTQFVELEDVRRLGN